MTLTIDFKDILRATLDDQCGNEGYIGISPDGRQYHVVVPVDLQIARGIKAGNRPLDGTPFGGYKHWHYFGCLVFPLAGRINPGEIQALRISQAKANALLLKAWAAELPVDLELSHWPE
ncbi:MAG TPA: hypothetical protein VLR91_03055 [Thermodesulfobacteriota bacterium]|nr:hypothetical protein [Thermodesulfobacteriota bacterium]